MAENGELQTFHVDIPMPGRHMVSNALAAAAVGRLYGLNAEQIKNGIESLEPSQRKIQYDPRPINS